MRIVKEAEERKNEIIKLNGYLDYVCDTDAVIRWCYIDLN